MFTALYYTTGRLPTKLQKGCYSLIQHALLNSGEESPELLVVSQEDLELFHNTCHRLVVPKLNGNSWTNMLTQIVLGLENAKYDYIYLVEHDMLYPPNYFQSYRSLQGPRVTYNMNVFIMNQSGFFFANEQFLSNCSGNRDFLLRHFKDMRDIIAETGREQIIVEPMCPLMGTFKLSVPVVDVRYGGNLTGDRACAHEDMYWDRLDVWPSHDELAEWLGIYKYAETEKAPSDA